MGDHNKPDGNFHQCSLQGVQDEYIIHISSFFMRLFSDLPSHLHIARPVLDMLQQCTHIFQNQQCSTPNLLQLVRNVTHLHALVH